MALKRMLLIVLLAPLALAQARSQTTLKSILLDQLRSTHNKPEWFVPVNTAVDHLTPEQARWIPTSNGPNNPAPADHSVGMITYHLLFWNTNALAKFKGEKAPPVPNDNSETFNDFDAANWPATVQKLDAVLTAWEQAVEAADDAKIAANATTISHIATHNAYHAGQIILIRKLQGSWNPANGVK
jgi:uncharacterized damage-inducible protein DinB